MATKSKGFLAKTFTTLVVLALLLPTALANGAPRVPKHEIDHLAWVDGTGGASLVLDDRGLTHIVYTRPATGAAREIWYSCYSGHNEVSSSYIALCEMPANPRIALRPDGTPVVAFALSNYPSPIRLAELGPDGAWDVTTLAEEDCYANADIKIGRDGSMYVAAMAYGSSMRTVLVTDETGEWTTTSWDLGGKNPRFFRGLALTPQGHPAIAVVCQEEDTAAFYLIERVVASAGDAPAWLEPQLVAAAAGQSLSAAVAYPRRDHPVVAYSYHATNESQWVVCAAQRLESGEWSTSLLSENGRQPALAAGNGGTVCVAYMTLGQTVSTAFSLWHTGSGHYVSGELPNVDGATSHGNVDVALRGGEVYIVRTVTHPSAGLQYLTGRVAPLLNP